MRICPSVPLSICVQSVFHPWLFDSPAKHVSADLVKLATTPRPHECRLLPPLLCPVWSVGDLSLAGRRRVLSRKPAGIALLRAMAGVWNTCWRPSAHTLISPINRNASTIVLAMVSVPASAILLAQLLRMKPDRRSVVRWAMLLALLGVVALLAFIPVFNCCTKEVFPYELGLTTCKRSAGRKPFPSCAAWSICSLISGSTKAPFL